MMNCENPVKRCAVYLCTLLLIGCNSDSSDSSATTVTTNAFMYRYPTVDTGQSRCYDDEAVLSCPDAPTGTATVDYYGQDAQFDGNLPSYSFYDGDTGTTTDTDTGMVLDNVTGLMWQNSPETDGTNGLTSSDKLDYDEAMTYCDELTLGGFSDWELPDIHQLYSLIMFYGTDPGDDDDEDDLIPFINTDYFDFSYGNTEDGERVVDSQYATSTYSVASYDDDTGEYSKLFGVNFADGRIKGYDTEFYGSDKTFFVMCVRNHSTDSLVLLDETYVDNNDDTISDVGAGLMWMKYDSDYTDLSSYSSEYTQYYTDPDYISGLSWSDALLWVQDVNNAAYLGYSDWRLPNAKELQALVDYTRSPDTTDSAAINELFYSSQIYNEAGDVDYPFYWSSTTHADLSYVYDVTDSGVTTDDSGTYGAYVAFGRALGEVLDDNGDGTGEYEDVHGVGAQRSDPKSGLVADYPTQDNPQGDVTRIYNTVRLVRDI